MTEDFLDTHNCYTANIRSYNWLTKYRNYIKKNTSKLRFMQWIFESSSLLYSDFLIYSIDRETNISNELVEILNNSPIIDKKRIIVDITRKSNWKNNAVPNDDAVFYGEPADIFYQFKSGDVVRVNLVELEDDEFEEVKNYLIESFDNSERNDKQIIAQWSTHPQTNKKIIMIAEGNTF